jgi:hypothetical protein
MGLAEAVLACTSKHPIIMSNDSLLMDYMTNPHIHGKETEMTNTTNQPNQPTPDHNKVVPHPNADVIIAWAEGKIVQYRSHVTAAWIDHCYNKSAAPPHFSNANGGEWRIKPEVKTGWINIYPGMLKRDPDVYDNDFAGIWKSEVEANNNRRSHCIACIQITYTEGEGLES